MLYKIILMINFLICISFSHAERFKVPSELDELLTLKPLDNYVFENNLYIGWMGIGYPEDNWQTRYKDLFQKNDRLIDDEILVGNAVTQYIDDHKKKSINNMWDISIKPFSDRDNPDEIILLTDQIMKSRKFYTFKQRPYGSGKKYISNHSFFTCGHYMYKSCITEMKVRKNYIETVVNDNQILLERFRILAKESKYNIALYFNDTNTSAAMMPRAPLSRVYQLNLADAIMDLWQGEMDNGLDNLVLARRWLDINYDLNSRPTIFQLVMNILYTQYLDQAMDDILNEGLLTEYLDDPRVEFIFRPYPKDIGKIVNLTLLWEIERNFKGAVYPYLKVYVEEPQSLLLSDEDEFIALSFFRSKGVFLPNKLFERHQELIQMEKPISKKMAELTQLTNLKSSILETTADISWVILQIMLDDIVESEHYDEWHSQFFFDLNATPKTVLNYLNYKYPSTEYYINYFETIRIIQEHKDEYLSVERLNELLEPELTAKYYKMIQEFRYYDSFELYWNRLYEQQNNHQLVYLKYLVIKNQIGVNEIPKFLESMGDYAKNTLTHRPYRFDPQAMMLSTPLPKDKKNLPVNIRNAYMDDHSIQNFEVRLPRYEH